MSGDNGSFDVNVDSESAMQNPYSHQPPTLLVNDKTEGRGTKEDAMGIDNNNTSTNNAVLLNPNLQQSKVNVKVVQENRKEQQSEVELQSQSKGSSPLSRFARKVSEFRHGSLQLIRERSASPKVNRDRKCPAENKRITKSDCADSKLKSGIPSMPPQVLTKSSSSKRLPPLDLEQKDIEKSDQELQQSPTTSDNHQSKASSASQHHQSEKKPAMAFAQQNNRIVKISPRKGLGHHHYYQHEGAKDSSANGNKDYSEPGICKRCMNHSQDTAMSPEFMKVYLKSHPELLEQYLLEEDGMELEQLERLMIRRTQRAKKLSQERNGGGLGAKSNRKTSLSRWRFCVHADKRQMLQDLTQSLQLRPTKTHVLFELSSCISSAVGADAFRLFIIDTTVSEKLSIYLGMDDMDSEGQPQFQKLGRKETAPIAQYVAKTREPIRFSRGDTDSRFPDGITDDSVNQVLCQAIVQPDGQIVGVLELIRFDEEAQFHEEDEEIAYSYLVWGGIALHYAHLFLNMNKQKKLNDFLLAVVKSIFQDMVSMDMLVMKVMKFAQRLVDADRASLFLVDSKSKELYATIFDVGSDVKQQSSDKDQAAGAAPKEIRFPLGTGIAGQVALTGDVLNIKNAYSDHRFNRSIDQMTGYKTESILCMPIFIRGSIIGVVQMVNKRTGFFTKEDEEAFETFAVYCGLALHHAKLYDKVRRSEQKYRVALEVLSYHNTCPRNEVEHCLNDPMAPLPYIDSYSFNPFQMNDFEKAQQAIYMFTDLFGLQRFDRSSIVKFTLTVRKNYRCVPYHNWTHGFSVANSMYSIIKHSKSAFRPNECLALYISSLCHDLDHRGKNNKFMLETESPLAAIYSTSTMEHHHFNQTVTILQQDGHNIFGKLTNNEYKQVLSLIKHCILATDLAVFFPNKSKLNTLIEENKFSWSIVEHRMLIQAIAMTASDLSAAAKPWEIQEKTVKVIFEEFYQQGDAERDAGRTPHEMMDRYKPDQQASSQVGFLTGICQPCYTLLWRLIPETKPLHDMMLENLHKWQEIADSVGKAKEDKDGKE